MASSCSINFLYEGLKILNSCDLAFKQAKDPRLMVELALMSLARIEKSLVETIEPAAKYAQPQKTEPKAPVSTGPANISRMPETPVVSISSNEPSVAQQTQQTKPLTAASGRNQLGTMTRLSDLNTRRPLVNEPVASTGSIVELEAEEIEQEVLTSALLKTYWMEFAEQLKEDQPRLYSTLTTQVPELSPDEKIILKLNNPLQEKAIRSIQTELLQFLRSRSGHRDLDMQTDVPEELAEKKLYTQEEKYQHLKKKNPDLDLFRQSLNLELE
jgi:DNA polymerase-3 subunit gamma/tau